MEIWLRPGLRTLVRGLRLPVGYMGGAFPGEQPSSPHVRNNAEGI